MAAPSHMCVFKHTEICTLKVIDTLRLKRMTKRDENKKKNHEKKVMDKMSAAVVTVQSQYNVESSKALCGSTLKTPGGEKENLRHSQTQQNQNHFTKLTFRIRYCFKHM